MKTPLIITPGDPDGIGPELVGKVLCSIKLRPSFPVLCVGSVDPFKKMRLPLEIVSESDIYSFSKTPLNLKKIYLLPAPSPSKSVFFKAGFQAGWSIKTAAEMVLQGHGRALVTGPIHKERLQMGGFNYSGHTDFLAAICKSPKVTMMLANDRLRVSLVTVHQSIHSVSSTLSKKKILQCIQQTAAGLRNHFGILSPKIAVLSLNPHMGENGLFGNEEKRFIFPAIKEWEKRKNFAQVLGPFSPDTFFALNNCAPKSNRFDAVVCMYHDQGLIPVKLLDFHRTVNITLGLPIIRTSVDHGVAFDIVGKGIANPSSLVAAIKLADRLSAKKGT